jgi:DNA-binding PadR family transcriptional regulator
MNGGTRTVTREILLSFWKVHILHHAGKGPIVGQWMLQELRRHGYEVSPGTMYPLLRRMERNGWLRCVTAAKGGAHARKDYYLTDKGRDVLDFVLDRLEELRSEVGRSKRKGRNL